MSKYTEPNFFCGLTWLQMCPILRYSQLTCFGLYVAAAGELEKKYFDTLNNGLVVRYWRLPLGETMNENDLSSSF